MFGSRLTTRRQVLAASGVAGAGLLVARSGLGSWLERQAVLDEAAAQATPQCVLSGSRTEGPYFVDEKLNRSDIRADTSDGSVEDGVPLVLTFVVLDNDRGCAGISGAQVDVWHANAQGNYSGVVASSQSNTDGQTFLRGFQRTDADGAATFTTVYPGWYQGRAVHIHFTIRDSAESQQGYEFTSQLYFDDALTDEVHSQGPYAEKGERDQRNSTDGIYQGGGDELTLALTPQGEGYAATFNIALDTTYA